MLTLVGVSPTHARLRTLRTSVGSRQSKSVLSDPRDSKLDLMRCCVRHRCDNLDGRFRHSGTLNRSAQHLLLEGQGLHDALIPCRGYRSMNLKL